MPWVQSRCSSASVECPASRACRSATSGHSTTSPSSVGRRVGAVVDVVAAGRRARPSGTPARRSGPARPSTARAAPPSRRRRPARIDSSASGLTPMLVEHEPGQRDQGALVDGDAGLVVDLDAHVGPAYAGQRPAAVTALRPACHGRRRRRRAPRRTARRRRRCRSTSRCRTTSLAGQVREVDVVDVVEDLAHHPQAAAGAAGQVDLGDVAGDDHLASRSRAGSGTSSSARAWCSAPRRG